MAAYTISLVAANRAPGTVRLHRHYLAQLQRLHPRGPWSATLGDLRGLMATPGWGPEAKKSCRAVLRGFYGWGAVEGLIGHNPAAGLAAIRVPVGVPRPAPEYVVTALVDHPDPRLALMGMLGAMLGLRCCEIARVHGADLVGDQREVLHVVGKGARHRELPVGNVELLERLREVEGWAFPNGRGSHLSPAHVSRLLSRELAHGWTAHPLRHRAATVANDRTHDVAAVSRMLGHSRLETTQRYVRVSDDALRAVTRAAGEVA